MSKKTKQKLSQPTKEHAEELKASLTQYNESFTTLLNLVPAKYYLTQEEDDDTGNSTAQLTRKQKRKLAQAAAEEKTQASLAKRAAKKAKYDPSTPRTVTEIQAAREEAKNTKKTKAEREAEASYLKGFDFNENSTRVNGIANGKHADDEDEDEEDSDNDIDFVGSDDDGAPAPTTATTAPSTSGRPSIAELRANLQSRPAASSNGGDDSVVGDGDASSAGKEALLAERKRQAELREKRRKSTKARIRQEKEDGTSSFKGKQKESMSALPLAGTTSKPGKMSDIKKQLKKEGKRQFFNFDTEAGPSAADDSAPAAVPTQSAPSAESTSTAVAVPQASTSSATLPSNSIAFSSLDFASSSALKEVDAPKLSKKQRENLGKNTKLGLTSHNPSVALSALNKREEFLSKLTPDARERAEEKDKWERMAMRAEGTKVYDDEAKLKKMLKKKEKSKDKSRKDWADRKETLQKTQAASAKKREDNISARLQQKKDKKMGVKPSKSVGKGNAKKKGRPGFEGKGGSKKK